MYLLLAVVEAPHLLGVNKYAVLSKRGSERESANKREREVERNREK